jgi:zinc protease
VRSAVTSMDVAPLRIGPPELVLPDSSAESRMTLIANFDSGRLDRVKRGPWNLLSAEGLSAVFAMLALAFSPVASAHAQERGAPPPRPRVPIYDPGQPVQKKVLSNGVTLLVQEQRTGPKVAGDICLKMGTLYEGDLEAGLSHVLIKSLVVGTTKMTPIELRLHLLAIKADVQSAAGPDFGHVSILTDREGAEQAASLLADMVLRPSFPDTSVISAKQQALQLASLQTESPIPATYALFLKGMYPGSPFARPVQGTAPAIASSRRSDILDLYKRYFVGGNMTVAFVGNFEAGKMMEVLEKLFGEAPAGLAPKPAGPEPKPLAADTVLTEKRNYFARSLVFGYPAPGLDDPDYPAFLVIDMYLKSTDRSPITFWLPTRGIAAGVGVIYAPYPKRSSIAVYLGAKSRDYEAARDSVAAVMQRLTVEPLDEGEWDVQIPRVQNSYFMNQRDPRWRSEQLAYLTTAGRDLDYPARIEKALLALTPEDVRAAAARWFTHFCEASILPAERDSN